MVVLWMDVAVSVIIGYHNRWPNMVAEFCFEVPPYIFTDELPTKFVTY